MAEFLQEYAGLIKGLTRNEKRDINVLSMLAEDNKQYAAGIVTTIENHILTCPAPSKLPALYVVDSIVKNVGDPYKHLFSQRLPEVFGAVWSSAMQDRRGSLGRLYNTWAGVFPADVLEHVQARMVSTSSRPPAQPAAPQPLAAAPLMQLGQPQGQPGMAYQLASSAMMAAPQQLLQQPQQLSFQQQQQQPVYMATTDLRGLAGQPQVQGSFQYAQPQQQQPLYYDAQPQALSQQPMYGAADGMGMPQQQFQGGPMQQQPMQYDQLQPMQPQAVYGDQFQPMDQQMHLAGSGYPIQTASPVDSTWQQQQPMQLPPQQPVYHAPPQDPRRAHRSPSPLIHAVPPTPPMPLQPVSPPMPSKPAVAGPVTGTSGGAPASAALTSMQLSSLLSTLAKTGVLGGGGAATRVPSPEEDSAIRTLDFTPTFLKNFHKAVVAELQRGSNRTRKDILDAAFTRKQRQKTAAAASRQWFVGVDAWIAGTLAVSEAAPAFFEEQAAKEQLPAEPVHNEPEDPSQPECAISGEPFDKFYAAAAPDGSTDEGWFYRDAVRLYGEEAARYGVPDGAIVKAKCLAEAGHVDSSAAVADVADAAGLAADMAAAAAGADAAAAAAGREGAPVAPFIEGGVTEADESSGMGAASSAEEQNLDEGYEEKGGVWIKPEEQEDDKEALKMEGLEGAEVAASGMGVKRSAEDDGQGTEPAKRARGDE